MIYDTAFACIDSRWKTTYSVCGKHKTVAGQFRPSAPIAEVELVEQKLFSQIVRDGAGAARIYGYNIISASGHLRRRTCGQSIRPLRPVAPIPRLGFAPHKGGILGTLGNSDQIRFCGAVGCGDDVGLIHVKVVLFPGHARARVADGERRALRIKEKRREVHETTGVAFRDAREPGRVSVLPKPPPNSILPLIQRFTLPFFKSISEDSFSALFAV